MPEREPQPGTENGKWDLSAMAGALEAYTAPTTHDQHGRGLAYEVGYGANPLQLTIYPETQIIKLEIEIAGVEPPQIDGRGVIFYAGHIDSKVNLAITSAGECALVRRDIPDPPESLPIPSSPSGDTDLPFLEETAVLADSGGLEAPSSRPVPLTETPTKKERVGRVKLTGTIRHTPHFSDGKATNTPLPICASGWSKSSQVRSR